MPRVYFAILGAIATGRVRQEEISQAVGVKGASLGYYLNTLRDLGLLERVVPVTDADPARSRQGRTRMWELAAQGRIPFRPQRVGMWWDAQAQIDVAALDEEYILLGECRWRSRPLGNEALVELKRKAERVPGQRHQMLALFSRAGFTDALQAEAARQGVLLFGLEDVLGA